LYKPLFPSGFIIEQDLGCLSEVHKFTHKWNLTHTQLSRSAVRYQLNAFHTPFAQLAISKRSMEMMVKGDTPLNSITFAIPINNASIVYQYNEISNQDLVVLEDGTEIDAIFRGDSEMLTISIHKNLFKKRYEKLFGEKYPITNKFEVYSCSAHDLQNTKDELLRILMGVKEDPSILITPQNVDLIENVIISNMINLVKSGLNKTRDSAKYKAAYSLYKTIQNDYDKDINIEILCKNLQISERNAYLTFKNLYSVTPKQFLISIRLKKIQQILLNANPTTTSIQQIALENGFYHMSHFAKIYKAFFKELPSQTLWRNK
jgi:AraC-like DNA-binding protein